MLQAFVHSHSLSSPVLTPILSGRVSVRGCIQLHVTDTQLQWLEQARCLFSIGNKQSGRERSRASTGTRMPGFLLFCPKLVAFILTDIR